MAADKLSVSLDPELGSAVREAARRRSGGVSAWMAEAAAAKLRNDALNDWLDDYQEEHGPFTEAELAETAAELGVPWPDGVVRPPA